MSRPYLPREYHASDLATELSVSSVPTDERTLHTLYATLIDDIDRRANIHQSMKRDLLAGVAQAWLYQLREHSGDDVAVEHRRHGVDTTVDSPDERRPASSQSYSTDEPRFDRQLMDNPDVDVSQAQFNRDMCRLDDLRRKYAHPGLNTAESNEALELRSRYNLSFTDWWQEAYRVDVDTPSSEQDQHRRQTL